MKVQHVGLRDTCAADTVIVEGFVKGLRWFFPDFNYQWLIDELKESVPTVSIPSFFSAETPVTVDEQKKRSVLADMQTVACMCQTKTCFACFLVLPG